MYIHLRNRKWPPVFIQPDGNTRESLGEFEILCEPKPYATKLSRAFASGKMNTAIYKIRVGNML